MKLKKRSAIVTGATGDIGAATAEKFLSEGAKVMLTGRSNEKLKRVMKTLDRGENIQCFEADVSNEAEVKELVDETVKVFGKVDIMFANAGTEGVTAPLEDQTLDDFFTVLNTNVIGVWLSIKYGIKAMTKNPGDSSIVVTSSGAGITGYAGAGPYIASKHAVNGLVKACSAELANSGIRINAVGPGPIDNRMMNDLTKSLNPEEPEVVRAAFEQLIPMQRWGTNEEVANLVTFLASDEASFCTGGIYMADGGMTATL